MIDELIDEKYIFVDGCTFRFIIKSLSGKRVLSGIGCRTFEIDFDIDNEVELQIIAKTLNAILTKYQVIDKDEKVVDLHIQHELDEFHKLMGIILSYKGS